jgi:hypothetical protein
MLNSNDMTKIFKRLIFISGVLLFTACDNDFVDINTNPYQLNSIDPALLFAGAQRTHLGSWSNEQTIVQQYVIPYNAGATIGFNFNRDIDVTGKFGDYTGSIKNMIQAMTLLGPTTERVNLMSMLRIWKAQAFMGLVDEYGDVPYFEAGKAVSEALFYPKYDDDAAIYDDLYKELKEATAALSPTADFVAEDLFYGARAETLTRTSTAAAQSAKWKKLGNSLLLRLGMRYSKVNPTKAQSIAAEAFAAGVMTSNADNAYVKYDGTLYTVQDNVVQRNFSQYNYMAEPFVNQLKNTTDPRARFIVASFDEPGAIGTSNYNSTLANQFGVPVGVTSDRILAGSPYRGSKGQGLNYSQPNVKRMASPAAPQFYVTYASTSLLLAEAAKRGWIPGGDASAKTYYDAGITADMNTYALYPADGAATITAAEITAYINDPAVLYTPTEALRLINTQYWVANVANGTEVFSNFRRSGFPLLTPNPVPGDLGTGGFIRRIPYPDLESSSNGANYQAAVAAIGGDKLSSRVFWDIP